MTLNKKRVTAIANAAQYVSETSRQERGGDTVFHSCNLRKLCKLRNFDLALPTRRGLAQGLSVSQSFRPPRRLCRHSRTTSPLARTTDVSTCLSGMTSISLEVDFSRRLADLCIHSVHRTG